MTRQLTALCGSGKPPTTGVQHANPPVFLLQPLSSIFLPPLFPGIHSSSHSHLLYLFFQIIPVFCQFNFNSIFCAFYSLSLWLWISLPSSCLAEAAIPHPCISIKSPFPPFPFLGWVFHVFYSSVSVFLSFSFPSASLPFQYPPPQLIVVATNNMENLSNFSCCHHLVIVTKYYLTKITQREKTCNEVLIYKNIFS